MSRIQTAFQTGIKEYTRTPALLGLFLFLPAYAVGLFSWVTPGDQLRITIGGETIQATMDAVIATVMAPMSAALITGIAGLFLMRSSRGADGRLVLAGYRAREVVFARIALLAGVAVLSSVTAVGVLWYFHPPASLIWLAMATVLVALLYGAVGSLAGVVLDRLPGVYLLLFMPLVDLFLFQNPLATDTPSMAILLPSHFPMDAAVTAALTGTVAVTDLGGGMAYLGLLTVLVVAAFYRATVVTS